MQKQVLVVNSNIFFLEQGIELLESVSDELYTSNNGMYTKSGIGIHFRHIIEHYFSLIHCEDGLIDYDARERDLHLENDRSFMISSMKQVIGNLKNLEEERLLQEEILVRSNEGINEKKAPLSKSTRRRELQFLISHTVHHYALIGLILKTMGFNPKDDFGVAPSTLKHEFETTQSAQVS